MEQIVFPAIHLKVSYICEHLFQVLCIKFPVEEGDGITVLTDVNWFLTGVSHILSCSYCKHPYTQPTLPPKCWVTGYSIIHLFLANVTCSLGAWGSCQLHLILPFSIKWLIWLLASETLYCLSIIYAILALRAPAIAASVSALAKAAMF